MNAGDIVWWTGGAPCRPRKVRLLEECGDGWMYEATGWRARAPRELFTPIVPLTCAACGRKVTVTGAYRFRPHNARAGVRCANRDPEWSR